MIKHIKNTFGITFILKKRPDGNHYILQLNKRNELMKFIDIVKKYVLEIPCMHYKVNVLDRLKEKQRELLKKYPEKEIIVCSLKINDNSYTKKEEKLIVEMKSKGCAYKEIADALGRSYWGITDKIRRMKDISQKSQRIDYNSHCINSLFHSQMLQKNNYMLFYSFS